MNDATAKSLETLARRREEASDARHELTQETAAAVREAHAKGATPTELANRLRVSRQAIYDFLD